MGVFSTVEAAVSALVSGVISVFFLGYIKQYFDGKLDAAEREKAQHDEMQRRRNVVNARLRRAEGRLMFWLHRAVASPPSNGELEEAWENYSRAEEEAKAIDQEIVADYEINR